MKSNKSLLFILFCSILGIILYSHSFFNRELTIIENTITHVREQHINHAREVIDIQAEINKVPLLLWKFIEADTSEKKQYLARQLQDQIRTIDGNSFFIFEEEQDKLALYNYVYKNWYDYKLIVLETITADANGDIIKNKNNISKSLLYLERLNNGMKMIVEYHQNDVAQQTINVSDIAQKSKQNIILFTITAVAVFFCIIWIAFRNILSSEKLLLSKVGELAEKNALLASKNLRIKQLAYEDSLTGLANRYAFQSTLSRELTSAWLNNKKGAVVFFDMDNFKLINDSYGHTTGDEFLTFIGTRIKAISHEKLCGARFGGDEFALFISDVDENTISHVLSNFIKAVFAPIKINELTLYPTASMGIALYPKHGISLDELLKKADIAMYEAKITKNAYRIFDGN
ncbi:GGDEF domain-containing protein [Dendrosporobacter sp. 1207_IL3150]|uniref:GGDEF domain-containing protein n=1 Tax=Dendrosporobacter sp. 1207_IL3150 TaxID=3084054 RepID=UPI002FDAA88A